MTAIFFTPFQIYLRSVKERDRVIYFFLIRLVITLIFLIGREIFFDSLASSCKSFEVPMIDVHLERIGLKL